MIEQILYGILFSGLIALIAYRKRSLTGSGAIAAVFVGTNIYAFGSVLWYGLLLVFFISSSLLSHLKKKKKARVEEDRFAKTGRRDAVQVLANGGLGTVLVWMAAAGTDPAPYLALYIGVMATVNADTWGTEVGVLSRGNPRHILTGKKVEKGTSGGLSVWGTTGTALGALCIGVFAAVFLWLLGDGWSAKWIYIGLLSGFIGALLDSLLGATVQRMYSCTVCGYETEKTHHCQLPAVKKRGLSWCNNDIVNLLSSVGGGLIAWVCWLLI